MRWIAHRGNCDGPKPELENSPNYILDALAKGFDVEVDAWFIPSLWHVEKLGVKDGIGWYLGHDKPTYKIPPQFLGQAGLWVHFKNEFPLQEVSVKNTHSMHYFCHDTDRFALTSKGYVWTCDLDAFVGNKTVLMVPDVPVYEIFYTKLLNKSIEYCCNDWVAHPTRRPNYI